MDYKHVLQAMAADIVIDTIGSLDLQWPTVSDEDRDANAKARSKLEAESYDWLEAPRNVALRPQPLEV